MASVVGAVAGTKVYIGTTAAVAPSPDLFTEVKEVASIGDIGTTFTKIAVESIGDGYTRQIKGTQSAPVFDITMNRDDDDPGQVALKTASDDRNSFYWFRVVENDGVILTFKGRIYGFPRKYGGVNALKQIATSIEIEPDSITQV